MDDNPILNASNAFFTVTNYTGASTLQTTRWLPLGTVGASATGEIGLKVLLIGSSGTATTTIGFSPTSGVTSAAAPQGSIYNASDTARTISASPGSLLFINVVNGHSAVIYVRFYNKIGATGSDTPVLTLAVPANGGEVFIAGADVPAIFTTACSVRA